MFRLGRLLSGTSVLALLAHVNVALAKGPAVAVAEGPKAGSALGVQFDAQGDLRAKVCALAPKTPLVCDPSGGTVLPVPPEARRAVSKATLGVVRLAAGHSVVWVSIPETGTSPKWQALVGAPLAGTAPLVLYADWVGLSRGEYGVREGGTLIVSDADQAGVRRVVRGTLREDLALCGREAVLSAEVLEPKSLEWRAAKVQRLSTDERGRATALTAERVDAPPVPGSQGVLRAVAASSAFGDPAFLTDGDPETTWSENRGGDGRGEFVVMRAPANLPLSAFEFAIRPKSREVTGGAAPSEFWIATSDRLFRVSMPEDAWRTPGARYRVVLDRAVTSDCVALVTEKSFAQGKATRVTFAELSARSELGTLDVAELVKRLGKSPAESQSAAATLVALGEPGFSAVAAAFASFDDAGRKAALDVLDAAPCEQSVPTFIDVATGGREAERDPARGRLTRCASVSGPALHERLGRAPRRAQAELAALLAEVAPASAVAGILPLFPGAKPELRLALRVALARASRSPLGAAEVRKAMTTGKLAGASALELLRSLGDRSREFLPEVSQLLADLERGADFSRHYLLLEPASALAAKNTRARSFVSRTLVHEQDARLRAKAAESILSATIFENELARATFDDAMRVRLAAVTALGAARLESAGDVVAQRLLIDDWPVVRAAAATALARFGPSRRWDAALVKGLEDRSEAVRRPALLAIGTRGMTFFAELVRKRLEDVDEWPRVRAAAAEALGKLCDTSSTDLLTEYAEKLKDPFLDDPSRDVAQAALLALGELHPGDLRARLKPLLRKDAPTFTRSLAERTLERRGSCRARPTK